MNGKLIPVFVLAALMSCSQPPVKEQGPRPVKLAEVTSLNLVEKSFSGVVSPDQFSDLAFKMSGPLISLKVDEGQKVRTGQVVAEIDPQDFKWEYEAKKASFQTAEAQATIMGGLFVSTILTIFVLPVTYCIFFKIKSV